MRLFSLCIGILGALLVLYFLGHEQSDVPPREASLPLAVANAGPAQADEPSPSSDASSAASAPDATRAPDQKETDRWQILPLEELRLAPAAGCFVRGKVRDSRTRTGLVGVSIEVLARREGREASMLGVSTNADGSFELRVPPQVPTQWEFERLPALSELESQLAAVGYADVSEASETPDSGAPAVEGKERLARLRASSALIEGRERANEIARREHGRDSRSRRQISIVLRASTPGYLAREVPLAIDPRADGIHDVGTIALEPGEVFTGRVLGLLEAGTANVDVHLVSADDLKRLTSTRTNARGEYALPMPLPGLYHVHARADGQGAGVLANVELPPFGEPILADVLLRGNGRLAGFVTYPDGSAAEAVSILAIPAEFGGSPRASIAPERLVYEEMNGGLYGSSATSLRDGSFEIPFLDVVPYLLSVEGDAGDDPGPPVHPPASVKLVYPLHRLRVRVRAPMSRENDWGLETVECADLVQRADGTLDRRTLGAPSESPGGGDRFFLVEPGHAYEVSALRAGQVLDLQSVQIRDSAYETLVDLYPRPVVQAAEERDSPVDPSAPRRAKGESADDPPGRVASTRLELILKRDVSIPAGTPLPPIEAALDRLAENGSARAVEVRWSAKPLPAGVFLPGRIGSFESQALPAGRYRLRLRIEESVFFEQELALAVTGEPSLPFLFASVPGPQDRASSAR